MPADINELHIINEDFEEFFVQFAEQIGKREVFVETDELLPVGTSVVMVFSLIYEDLPFFKADGTVSYVVEPGQSDSSGGHVAGMSVKIDEMDDNIRAYLVELIKSQLKSELSRMFTT